MNILFVMTILCPIFFTLLVIFFQKKTTFSKCSDLQKKILIGIGFGLCAIFANEFGYTVSEGAICNVRDSSVICAGLLFGGPAGIIAGFMGGIERFVSVLWNGNSLTQIPCTIATIGAGFCSTFIRYVIYKDKSPSTIFVFFFSMAAEVFHMFLVLILNTDQIRQAFEIVVKCSNIMTLSTAIIASICSLICFYFANGFVRKQKAWKLSEHIELQLLAIILILFCLSTYFIVIIQIDVALKDAEDLLTNYINDYDEWYSGLDESNIQFETSEDTNSTVTNIEETYSYASIGEKGRMYIIGNNTFDDVVKEYSDAKNLNTAYKKIKKEFFTSKINKKESYCMVKKYDYGYIMAYISKTEANYFNNINLYLTVFSELLMFVTIYGIVYYLIQKDVVDRLNDVNDGLVKITSGNLNTKVQVNDYEEFKDLSNRINETVDSLKGYINKESERNQKDLELAQKIQSSSLPSVFPYNEFFDIFASMNAAKKVGGDFYDYFRVSHEKLVFLIADVSGKGIPAALFMMQAKSIIKNNMRSGMNVAEAFMEANKELCEGNEGEMFVTAWIGELDFTTGKLQYANAGHNPPLICRKEGTFEYLKSRVNFVLAGMPKVKYALQEIQINPGDKIYLYTDGVTEATNPKLDLYGETRLQSCLNQFSKESTENICTEVLKDVRVWADGSEQADDITMLCLEYKKEMRFSNDTER